jgi:hypothetical protein
MMKADTKDIAIGLKSFDAKELFELFTPVNT